MLSFVGIDLGREPVPDETTLCKFRHLLEQHGLGERLFGRVNEYLAARGLKIGTGTIVDATLIEARHCLPARRRPDASRVLAGLHRRRLATGNPRSAPRMRM